MKRALLLLALLAGPAQAQVIGGGGPLAIGGGGGASIAAGSYWFYEAYPNVSLTGTQSEAVMFDVAMPANVLGPVGMLRITTQWTMTNNANAKTPRVRWGLTANSVVGNSIAAISGVASVSVQQMQSITRNTNATGSQTTFNVGSANLYGTSTFAISAETVDTTQATHLTVTGLLAVSTDTLTLTGITVEALHP